MITAVDTNVLIDLVGHAGELQEVAFAALERARQQGLMVISVVVYAELVFSFTDVAALESLLADLAIQVEDLDRSVATLAGRYYRQYRDRGGLRPRILPDFLIAAHAELRADRLLTRDARFFGMQFTKLKAIHPDEMQPDQHAG